MNDQPPAEEHRLPDFIRDKLEAILQEWEEFAQSTAGAKRHSSDVLRDHAAGMLLTIADEIERADSSLVKPDEAQGRGRAGRLETEAQRHGAARLAIGFSASEAIAEFRALRESVLRLWSGAVYPLAGSALSDTNRFNDAIDQALAESLERYSLDTDEATRRFDTLLSDSPDLKFILDRDGVVIYANQTMARLLPGHGPQLAGQTVEALCPALAPAIQAGIAAVAASGEHHSCELVCHADGAAPVTYRTVLLPVLDGDGKLDAVSGSARNISQLKASEEKIVRQAFYDGLTGLPNRTLFLDRLDLECRHAARTGRRLALLYVDLDGFKGVNDRYGHAEGDLLLQETARRLSGCVRASDTVARLGGDEFTVILPDFRRYEQVETVARDILAELARPFRIRGNELHISCSIGITLHPDDARQPEDLVRNADQAMFVAKKAGRGRFSYFTAEMRDSASARLRTIDELRRALGKGELSVYYQPIVDIARGKIVKAEALLRWQHPERGLTLPSEFIGLAEETGLIQDIGAAVLADAAERVRRWSALRGAPFPVSVNKSPVEFMDPARLLPGDHDLALLQACGKLITVEITESVMLSDSHLVRQKLFALRQAGVQLAIDDFGIGYSSMALLKSFKVDYLKIDQSFVKDIMVNDESRVFAETIIGMAHKLGLEVIAEGVETAAQFAWLRASGCDFGQGFLFSAATAPEQFERMLQEC